MMSWPVVVSPVNAMAETPGCATSAAPAVGPKPGTTLSTPGGSPASSAISPRRSAVSGVSSAGFKMAQFPAASAGAIFREAMRIGKFHGTMSPTTPSGSRSV